MRSRFVSVLSLVFELGEDAFVLFDVVPRPQIHRLIQGVALPEGIQEAALDYITHRRDLEVRRNGDVAHRNPPLTIEQTQFNAALVVKARHHSRQSGVELVLELTASAVWPPGSVGGTESLEDDAVLPLRLQMPEQPLLVGWVGGGLDEFDVRDAGTVEQQAGELDQSSAVRLGPIILAIPLQQVEGEEHIAHTLAVHNEVAVDLLCADADRRGKPDGEPVRCRNSSAPITNARIPLEFARIADGAIRGGAARSALTDRKLHEASCIMPGSRASSVPKSLNTAWHPSRLVIVKW